MINSIIYGQEISFPIIINYKLQSSAEDSMQIFFLSIQLYNINYSNMRNQPKPQNPNQSPTNNSLPDQFSYEFFQSNRYSISESDNYEALCNNGFIKLYTKLCRVYWHTQNEFNHQVHDWKFHVSVRHDHVRQAWNLLAGLFIKLQCRAGMKVIYLRQSQHPTSGREITIYLIKMDPKFENSSFAGDFGLSMAVQHSEDYWFNLCQKVEECLTDNEISPNGLADGDYPLGKYISFRNEAFVEVMGNSIYPPNNVGWNPLKYQRPINLKRFQQLKGQHSQPILIWKSSPYLIIASVLIAGFFLWRKLYSNTIPK